jgi:hypothetical protein
MCPFDWQHDERDKEEKCHGESSDVDPICDFCTGLKACNIMSLCCDLIMASTRTIGISPVCCRTRQTAGNISKLNNWHTESARYHCASSVAVCDKTGTYLRERTSTRAREQ